MKTWTTLLFCTATLASSAQQSAAWNIHAQLNNPLWGDANIVEPAFTNYSMTAPNSTEKHSIAFGGIVERQFANGCAVRLGFEHARNALDRFQTTQGSVQPWWSTTDLDMDRRYRQETNTFSVGATHYLAFGRLEPYFGGEAMMRIMDDLKETAIRTERQVNGTAIVYMSTERIRYSGGTQFGFAPIVGFRYRIVCDLYLGAEFTPTWAWGEFGKTRTSTSTQDLPDEYTYVNATTYGGSSGGPYFLPRFGVGLSYRLKSKKSDAPTPAGTTEPMIVPVK